MAETIEISSRDVQDAENYLESLMGTEVTDGDFSKGTALRDLAVKAISVTFAFLRGEARQVRLGQSLKTVAEVVGRNQEELRGMVEAILSNVFVSFRSGAKSRGVGVGHATDQVDLFVPVGTKFTYAPDIVFVPDAKETLFIPAGDLIPIYDATGTVLDWQFNIPLVAADIGEIYNVTAGLFAAFDRFSPYVTRIEVIDSFAGGKPVESVAAALERAPTAISVRNLINARSINAVLSETFPEINKILVVEYGDPEMQRDRLEDAIPHLQFHVGGCADIYIRQALVETTTDSVVGATTARPDGLITLFRDATVANWTLSAVQVGDVIRVSSGIPSVPRLFRISSIHADYLEVTPRIGSAFPIATDEESPVGTVDYTIGRTPPYYVEARSNVGAQPLHTGKTSRSLAEAGRITLPALPIMDIVDVAVLNPPPAEAALQSGIDGYVHFTERVNAAPQDILTPGQALQYRLIGRTPLLAQSAQVWNQLQIGPEGNLSRWDGCLVRVRFRTLSGFSAVHAFASGTEERMSCASQLVRGLHPIVLSATISYRLAKNAPATLDDDLLSSAVATFISEFDTSMRPLDVSAITDYLRSLSPSISAVFQFNIQYALSTPTGDVIEFETADEVTLNLAKQTYGPTLDLLSLGVSARTVQYLANDKTIIVQAL